MDNINTGMIMDGVSNAPKDFDKNEEVKSAIDNRLLESIARYKAAHTPRVREYKIGRNDPCPCGSGLKYKNCCLKEKTYEGYKPLSK
jgi:uncharacterized protein YecA (UPF0149 family)